MSQLWRIKIASLCILLSIFSFSIFHIAQANEVKTIQVQENFQSFLPLRKFSQITDLYRAWKLSFDIKSSIWLELIERDNRLVFWAPIWTFSGTGELVVSLGWKSVSVPVELEKTKDLKDYSIADDMFQLSLQEKTLSCESSATSDIISSFLGQNIHEDEIIKNLPTSPYFNSLPLEHPDGVTIWGNPETAFVGYIDSTDEITAKQKLMTGYGVYEAPIAAVYKKKWFQTQIMNKSHHSSSLTAQIHLRYLLEKLKRWSMVQLWWDWCTREEYDDWVLESKREFYSKNIGLKINAKNTCYNVDEARELKWSYYDENGNLVEHIGLDGEHAFILLGWKWSITNPSHIRVWDTDTGYHIYPISEWMRKWKKMDYRSIVISKK